MDEAFQPVSPKLSMTLDQLYHENVECHSQLSNVTHPHYSCNYTTILLKTIMPETTMYTRMMRMITHVMNKKLSTKVFKIFTIMNDKKFHKQFSFW